MQLLKLTQTYNTTWKPNTVKQNPKTQFMNILEKCIHVPKDDRLVLRRYLSSLSVKQLDQNNQVIAILLKYASKKGKDNVDKKLQILLRKQADRIRKQDQIYNLFNKNQQAPPKIINRRTPIDPKVYCNNFQMMKSSVRNHSSKKSINSNMKSLNQSMQKEKMNQPIKQMKFKSRLTQNYKRSIEQSNKKSKKNLYSNSSIFKRQLLPSKSYSHLLQSQTTSNIMLNKLSHDQNSGECRQLRQIHQSYQQCPIQKHRPTKSRSLGDIIMNYNQNYHIEQKYQVCSQYVKQQNILECGSIQPIDNLQNSSISFSLSNYNSFNSNLNSFCSILANNPKSPQLELKQLRLCSEDLHDFIIPSESKFSRSPSDLSIPYNQFIQKLILFVSNAIQISYQTIYVPFNTQYDLVTFQKFTQFLNEYTYPKFYNNSVRDLFTRLQIGVGGLTHGLLEKKKINIQEFNKAYEWKRPLVRTKFEQLVKRCNRWCKSITYWQFYWLKDSSEYKEFEKEFNSD